MIPRKVCISEVVHVAVLCADISCKNKNSLEMTLSKSTGYLNKRIRDYFDQSTDCSVSSSNLYGRISTLGTPTEGYQKISYFGTIPNF